MHLLRERRREASIPDGVSGEARVLHKELTWLGSHTPGQADKRWRLRLAVSGPAVEDFEVEHVCTIPWDKVPRTGQTVPVTFSRAKPSRVRVEWDRAESISEAARRAEALVAAGDLPGAAAAMGFKLTRRRRLVQD